MRRQSTQGEACARLCSACLLSWRQAGSHLRLEDEDDSIEQRLLRQLRGLRVAHSGGIIPLSICTLCK